ncbi:MAG: hypothetical protein HYV03_00875, partial [Deltaproteobacteria bacterium]|nr:hypothetical protein [Deltaproteobacteria bacterium]
GLIVPILDARLGEVFSAAFRTDGTAVLPEQATTPAAWAERIRATGEQCCCFGEGFLRYKTIFTAVGCKAPSEATFRSGAWGGGARQRRGERGGAPSRGSSPAEGRRLTRPQDVHRPRAALVAVLATEKLVRGEVADLNTLVPNYLRKSVAEDKGRLAAGR